MKPLLRLQRLEEAARSAVPTGRPARLTPLQAPTAADDAWGGKR
jgi:hypothetical protein